MAALLLSKEKWDVFFESQIHEKSEEENNGHGEEKMKNGKWHIDKNRKDKFTLERSVEFERETKPDNTHSQEVVTEEKQPTKIITPLPSMVPVIDYEKEMEKEDNNPPQAIEAPETKDYKIPAGSYYCSICEDVHRESSKKGAKHTMYQVDAPEEFLRKKSLGHKRAGHTRSLTCAREKNDKSQISKFEEKIRNIDIELQQFQDDTDKGLNPYREEDIEEAKTVKEEVLASSSVRGLDPTPQNLFYCQLCNDNHIRTSQIGRKHAIYESTDIPPEFVKHKQNLITRRGLKISKTRLLRYNHADQIAEVDAQIEKIEKDISIYEKEHQRIGHVCDFCGMSFKNGWQLGGHKRACNIKRKAKKLSKKFQNDTSENKDPKKVEAGKKGGSAPDAKGRLAEEEEEVFDEETTESEGLDKEPMSEGKPETEGDGLDSDDEGITEEVEEVIDEKKKNSNGNEIEKPKKRSVTEEMYYKMFGRELGS